MRSKNLKTALMAGLSILLASCAGSPPKQERPVKFYGGVPERAAMCRVNKETLIAAAKRIARHSRTKAYAKKVIEASVAADAIECIGASEQKFASMVGIPADDLRVLLQFQEDLLYGCERWKQ